MKLSYKGYISYDNTSAAIGTVEYHVNRLAQFQNIIDKSGEKWNFEGCLSVSMKLGERPVICLGQDEAIIKQYIVTNNMWNHRGKIWIVPSEKKYAIMILTFHSK